MVSKETKELSNAELNEIAGDENAPEVSFSEPSDNVLNYIKGNKLEAGTVPVANFLIYHHYFHDWEPKGKKLSYIEFFRQFNRVFNQKRTKKTRYYMLGPGIYKLDKDSIDVARRFQKEQEEKNSKK